MPWIVGIDEAGYGPNLGPFVMSAVACRLPDDLADADLWHVLGTTVRRHGAAADDRLLVDDSKRVYSPGLGLSALEIGVLATLLPDDKRVSLNLDRFLHWASSADPAEVREECWYSGQTELPVHAEPTAGNRR